MSEESPIEVCVVGAGAAGLWAAATAARAGARVVLLEKTARTGTKVLASGGTRCNLTTTLGADAAAQLFGPDGARFLRRAFRALSPQDVRARFAALGVATVAAPLEKIFPASDRARDVRDALEREAREAGVEIRCGAAVAGVERGGPCWQVVLADGTTLAASTLLLCPGGASYPRSGTTGDGWAWLEELGLPVVPPRPALVPLTSPATWVRELSGISAQEAEVRLVDGAGRKRMTRRRPVLFTHAGLSGPAALDVSRHVARDVGQARERGEAAPAFTARLDLLPDLSREALRELIVELTGSTGAPRLRHALPAELPRRLFAAIAVAHGLEEPDPKANRLGRDQRHRWIEALKGLEVPIDGTAGFDKAEVTTGGLALTALDPGTMAVNGCPGLYVFGELVDLDGPVGGLNFQAAFSTAELAGHDAARRARELR